MISKRNYVSWTEEELGVLKKVWENPEVSFEDLPKILKSRTIGAIKSKAGVLELGGKAGQQPDIDYEFLKSLTDVKDI